MIDGRPKDVDPDRQHVEGGPQLKGVRLGNHPPYIGGGQGPDCIVQVIPERRRIPELPPKERIGEHRKHQAEPDRKRQERQKGLHCLVSGFTLGREEAS